MLSRRLLIGQSDEFLLVEEDAVLKEQGKHAAHRDVGDTARHCFSRSEHRFLWQWEF